ncbi:MAG: peptidoglycan DD-metalloendopeptidase family protein [Candidatus Liptonbacteria bacterium]|nr:peptidoglycan DD-metalloendopeptidase family protein [Candidatus Liptonbacteria bacterium]
MRSKIVLILLIIGFLTLSSRGVVKAQTPQYPQTREGLEKKIQDSAEELKKLQEEIRATEESLKNTKTQKTGLQRELASLQNSVNKLNLEIQSDKITIQKLSLEIESLGYDIEDIKLSMADKKEGVGQILREIQKKDDSNLLTLFLKNSSLSQSVLEAQALANLSSQLAIDISKLRDLSQEYSEKLDVTTVKKNKIAFQQKNLESKKVILVDQKTERETLLKATKNQETLYQESLKDLNKRQQEIASEIEKIEAELRKNIDPSVLPVPRPGVLLLPVLNARMSQDYGSTNFAQFGYRGKWHNGLDFAAPIGTPIFAAEGGTVTIVDNQDKYCYKGAYGKYIIIEHQNNLVTLYAHLSLQSVKIGQEVRRGDVIGYVGKTGYATGSHLHFTVFAKPTFIMKPSRSCGPMPVGGDMDPAKYL